MPGHVMHVVAHPDDDLFFINPDVSAAIDAQLPVVTVYVTAGQLTGNGSTDGQRARNRQLGVMAAYAQMCGISTPQWTGTTLWSSGRQVEAYTLQGTAAPVELVFVNLPDGGLDAINSGQSRTTVLVTGGLVTRTFSSVKADVVGLLAGLMARYQPTVVHTLDQLPDTRYAPEHADHVAVAKFAALAAAAYCDALPLVNHRCYTVQDSPADLNATDRAAKQMMINAYATYDSGVYNTGWVDSTYLRWPRGGAWMGRNADGRLQLFVVRGGVLWTWVQSAGGAWNTPQVLGGAGGELACTIAVGANADGRLQVFGRRLTDHKIVSTYQTAVNGGWAASWVDLGNPNTAYGNGDQVGAPSCVLLGNGRILLVVRNGGGGVSAKTQTGPNVGFPAAWTDLGGSDVQGELSGVVNPTGCVELVAATRTGILHWYQNTVGGALVLNTTFPGTVPASLPSTVLLQDGTVAVTYRGVGGEVVVNRQAAPAAGWNAAVTAAGRPGATGPVVSGRDPMLLSRTCDGMVSVGVPSGGSWTWSDLDGGPFIDTPAAGVDASGAVVLATVGMDGVVRVRTQVAPGVAQPFGAWQALPA
ncbi:PIG-L family deacetylase [Dactylosporangium aurantiacum]|uniref:PIG-L family deacetylase n=1 Tax=Dactylosporangium aurantiacum TaxID=35754 RepID=A0A9Q9IBJ0_9ACTN|nr:PIG-L family deacetylase [Dactylosporangium aurantiacum]MDG6102294.1 PIG-L family deacetylase [Dactylosporangium aurantiacum]UWZ53399.1 PIG-L family deacetylase [Dactylosporangium aurantiacum]